MIDELDTDLIEETDKSAIKDYRCRERPGQRSMRSERAFQCHSRTWLFDLISLDGLMGVDLDEDGASVDAVRITLSRDGETGQMRQRRRDSDRYTLG